MRRAVGNGRPFCVNAGRESFPPLPLSHSARLDVQPVLERLRWPPKNECVYPNPFVTGFTLRAGVIRWIGYYGADRSHSGLVGWTPNETYGAHEMTPLGRLTPPTEIILLAA